MADVSLSNLVAGLVGGATGSVLTFVGGLYLQTRAERRLRRARLLALETELRWNRMNVESVAKNEFIGQDLTDHCWRDNYVALAADLAARTYSDLRLLYHVFRSAAECYDRVRHAEASKEDREFLVWWSEQALRSQALVTEELHVTWKLRHLVARLAQMIGSLIPDKQGEKPLPGGDGP
ncbi:MAG: hypothetical protein Q8P22_06635 [Chloroflexota bacterium]|nr:hypothetical protein [Chloroflexota bacterium]